jgi:type II secretory pathway pseudopilin PulG
MKKIILSIALMVFLCTPIFASAQTVSQDAVKQQLIAVIKQLIIQLEQQIQQILAQQNQIITITPTPTICYTSWQCGDWNGCINNQQTRNCWDTNNCNTTNNEPVLSQYCSIPTPTPEVVPMCARTVPSTCRFITNW